MSFVEPSVERRSVRLFKQKTDGQSDTPTWLTLLNSLFYVAVLLAVVAFGYYLYTSRETRVS